MESSIDNYDFSEYAEVVRLKSIFKKARFRLDKMRWMEVKLAPIKSENKVQAVPRINISNAYCCQNLRELSLADKVVAQTLQENRIESPNSIQKRVDFDLSATSVHVNFTEPIGYHKARKSVWYFGVSSQSANSTTCYNFLWGFDKYIVYYPCMPQNPQDSTYLTGAVQSMTKEMLQNFYVYRRNVQRGKCNPNPFDPSRKPEQSVLKNSTPSPISPFFKRAYNIKIWTPEVTIDQLIEQSLELETEV